LMNLSADAANGNVQGDVVSFIAFLSPSIHGPPRLSLRLRPVRLPLPLQVARLGEMHNSRPDPTLCSGWYRNVNRGETAEGERGGASPRGEIQGSVHLRRERGPGVPDRTRVPEGAPRLCPRCAGARRLIAFIGQPELIEKVLTPPSGPAPP
jgi:hypothetical protein